jgi:hypothetical protein
VVDILQVRHRGEAMKSKESRRRAGGRFVKTANFAPSHVAAGPASVVAAIGKRKASRFLTEEDGKR